MNDILCIYPKDATTEFLRPVYNAICAKPHVVGLELDTIEDDDFLEKLSDHLADADGVFFLGHGSSTCLYGTNLHPLIEDKMALYTGRRNSVVASLGYIQRISFINFCKICCDLFYNSHHPLVTKSIGYIV